MAKHRRTNQEPDLGLRIGDLSYLGEEIGDDRLDAQGHGRRTLSAGQEVRDAGDDADVGLDTQGLQRLGEQGHAPTLDNLSAGHERPTTDIVLTHVTLRVRVANDSDAAGLSHDDKS